MTDGSGLVGAMGAAAGPGAAVSPQEQAQLRSDYTEQVLGFMRQLLTVEAAPSDEARQELAWRKRRLSLMADQCGALGCEVPEARLVEAFGLAGAEVMALWLAALPYLDGQTRELLGRVHGASSRNYVTADLCVRLLAQGPGERRALWHSFQQSGRLMQTGLVRRAVRDGDPNPMRHEVVPAADVVAWLCGMRTLSEELEGVARWCVPSVGLEALQPPEVFTREIQPMLEAFWDGQHLNHPWFGVGGFGHPLALAVMIHGEQGSGRTTALKGLAHELRRAVIEVEGRLLRSRPLHESGRVLAAMCREAMVYEELVIVRQADEVVRPDSPLAPLLARALSRFTAPVVLCVKPGTKLDASLEPSVLWRTSVAVPSAPRIWHVNMPRHAVLGGSGGFNLGTFTKRFALSPLQVSRAARAGSLMAPRAPREAQDGSGRRVLLDEELLEQAARNQIEADMGELAHANTIRRTIDELILSDEVMSKIVDVLHAARNRQRVLHEWNLGDRIRRGTGLCCMFDGEPGTGKTLTSEILASELRLQLMRINTSQIVNKFIGETEKNLERIFDRARPDTHLLLFDEADTLFAKRTEVKHSNDRYSNMNVGVLLQLIERYEGLVVLTTNLKNNIDKAFERRIMFKINFPIPERPERVRLWKHLLPSQVPTRDTIRYRALAHIELTGGEIKNAIMMAAYAAARAGQLMDMEILYNSALRAASDAGRLIRHEAYAPDDDEDGWWDDDDESGDDWGG